MTPLAARTGPWWARWSIALILLAVAPARAEGPPSPVRTQSPVSRHMVAGPPAATADAAARPQPNEPKRPDATTSLTPANAPVPLRAPTFEELRPLGGVVLIGLASLAPAVVLMFTSFVRINIVLLLLRQALGSPQVPGNQVLTALAVLLSALVMQPVAESVYARGIRPYAVEKLSAEAAWEAGTTPVKVFMVRQIQATDHLDYLWELYDLAEPNRPVGPSRMMAHEFPLRVVAPAFLLSEITTALTIGFLIYLPFLVVDLVVAAVLSAMGLFMLPPAFVAMPLKLILFVLADGWLLVATALLRTFATESPG